TLHVARVQDEIASENRTHNRHEHSTSPHRCDSLACQLRGQDASEPLALSAGSFAETHRRRGGHDADVDELGFKKGVTLDNLGNALGCGAKSGHGTDVA